MRHSRIDGPARRHRRPLGAARVLVAGAALASSLALAAIALAAKPGFVLSSSHSSKLGEQIVVDSHGDTLYALSPETVHHLLCKSKECLRFWPPLTVSSRKEKLKGGAGVKGDLGLLRRKHGVFQVTLRGMPLYRFSGDSAPGDTNGQGIKGFGGTWFAATASRSPKNAPSSTQQGATGGNGVSEYQSPGTPAPSPTGPTGVTTTSSTTSTMSSSTTSTYSY